MTRHFSHIFFTELRTFTLASYSRLTVHDPSPGEVVGGKLHDHPIPTTTRMKFFRIRPEATHSAS